MKIFVSIFLFALLSISTFAQDTWNVGNKTACDASVTVKCVDQPPLSFTLYSNSDVGNSCPAALEYVKIDIDGVAPVDYLWELGTETPNAVDCQGTLVQWLYNPSQNGSGGWHRPFGIY